VSLGPLEHDIRRVPGVLALQFTPTELFVLVEPSADVAQVTAVVEALLAVAAEARRVAVIGGTSAPLVWPRRRVAALVGAAAVSVFAAGAAAAVASGVFHSGVAARPPTHNLAAPPPNSPTSTGSPLTTEGHSAAVSQHAPSVSTRPAAQVQSPKPQILRISLPSPLPAAAAAAVRDIIAHPPVVAPPAVSPPPVMKPPPGVTPPPVITPPPVVPPEDVKSDRREHCEDDPRGRGDDFDPHHRIDADHDADRRGREHDVCR
jgi:hypothetical protein